MSEKMTVEGFTKSLNGFEEIAIQRVFQTQLTELSSTMAPRALLFVQWRREGAKDHDAYQRAMSLPLGELENQFADPAVLDEEKAIDSTGPSPTS